MGGCWSFLGCLRTSCISMGKITDIQNLPLLLAIFYEIIFPIDTTLYSNLLYCKSWTSWFCLEITKLWVGTWEDVAVYSCELQGASTNGFRHVNDYFLPYSTYPPIISHKQRNENPTPPKDGSLEFHTQAKSK